MSEPIDERSPCAESAATPEHDGPVFLPKFHRFFADVHAAAEYIADLDLDPTQVTAHPCLVGKVAVPDLLNYITESWLEEFDDPDAVDVDISTDTKNALAHAVELLAAEAPTAWTPLTRTTIALPHFDGYPATD